MYNIELTNKELHTLLIALDIAAKEEVLNKDIVGGIVNKLEAYRFVEGNSAQKND